VKAAAIANAAAALVGGDRERTHGNKTDNHQRIADMWNGVLRGMGKPTKLPLDAHDAACLMEVLKIARRYAGEFNIDDYIDGSGYACVAGEIKAEQIRRDQTWASAAVADAAIEGCPTGPVPATFSDVCAAMRDLLDKASGPSRQTARAS